MKPIVLCELIELKKFGDVFVAHLQRTSPHPVIGPDVPGKTTVTSRVLRIDFDFGMIETLNTYYIFRRG